MRFGFFVAACQFIAVLSTAIPMVLSAQQLGLRDTPSDTAKDRARAIERAKAALVRKLEVSPGAISLESAAPRTWPDASLGCPEKDRLYAQVVTSGYAVVLTAKGATHEVHVSAKRVAFCPAAVQPPVK